jgi:hypothetical protein
MSPPKDYVFAGATSINFDIPSSNYLSTKKLVGRAGGSCVLRSEAGPGTNERLQEVGLSH